MRCGMLLSVQHRFEGVVASRQGFLQPYCLVARRGQILRLELREMDRAGSRVQWTEDSLAVKCEMSRIEIIVGPSDAAQKHSFGVRLFWSN